MRRVLVFLAAAMAAAPVWGAGFSEVEAEIIGRGVRLRAGPGVGYPVRDSLNGGRVRVVGRAEGWYRVACAGEGWVNERYLRLDLAGRVEAGSRAEQLLRTAQSLLGRGYVYGGAGPSCFDCSGLVHYLFRQIGIALPREAGAQMRAGTAISAAELRPGDLVFFATTGTGRISHVGVYLFAGEFIHASSGRGCVTTSTMNQGYYRRNFAGAARVIQ